MPVSVPDSTAVLLDSLSPMRITRVLAIAALAAAPLAGSLSAQVSEAAAGRVLHVSPYAGFMVFGNYLSGPLNTSLTNKPGMLYGTQVGLSLSRDLQLIGNVGYTSSDIDV